MDISLRMMTDKNKQQQRNFNGSWLLLFLFFQILVLTSGLSLKINECIEWRYGSSGGSDIPVDIFTLVLVQNVFEVNFVFVQHKHVTQYTNGNGL